MKINHLLIISFLLLMGFSACQRYEFNEYRGVWRQKMYNNTDDSIVLYCQMYKYKIIGVPDTVFQSFRIDSKHEYSLNTGIIIHNNGADVLINGYSGPDKWRIDSIKKGDKGCKSLDTLFDRSKRVVVRNRRKDNVIDWIFVVEEDNF